MAGFIMDPAQASLDQAQGLGLGLGTAQGLYPGSTENSAANYTNAANSVKDYGPASAALKGYLTGKAVSSQEKIDAYENHMKTQIEEMKVRNQQADLAKKQADKFRQDNEAYLTQVAPTILHGPDVQSQHYLEEAYNKLSSYMDGVTPNKIRIVDVKNVPNTVNSEISFMNLTTGEKWKEMRSRQDLIREVLPTDKMNALSGTATNSKPVSLDLKDATGQVVQRNVTAALGSNGQYVTTDGQVIDPARILAVDGAPMTAPGSMSVQDGPQPGVIGPDAGTGQTATQIAEQVAGQMQPVNLNSPQAKIPAPAPGMPTAMPEPKDPAQLDKPQFETEDYGVPKTFSFEADQQKAYLSGDQVKAAAALQASLSGNNEVKSFKSSLNAMQSAIKLAQANTGVADIGLTYNIMKAFDPTSTVRETEFQTLEGAQRAVEKLRLAKSNAYAAVKSMVDRAAASGKYGATTPLYTPAVRAEMLDAAYANMSGRGKSYIAETLPAGVQAQGIPPSAYTSVDPAKVQYFLDHKPDFHKAVGIRDAVNTNKLSKLSDDELEAKIQELQGK